MALSALASELNSTLAGARTDKIVQPENDEVRFYFRAGGKNVCLCASCNSGAPRLHLTSSKKQNPATAPSLCMLLRKHLSVSTLESVEVFNADRIIRLRFKARTEMKDDATYFIFFEIMNRYSNLVFTDGNGIILDAVKHLPLDSEREHVVLRGIQYKPVPQSKTSYLTTSFEFLKEFNGGDLHRFILDNVCGLSGLSVSELLFRCGIDSEHSTPLNEEELSTLIGVFEQFQNIATTPLFKPCLQGKKEVYPFPYCSLDSECETFDTMSEAYDALFTSADAEIRNKARLKTLSTAVKHLRARVEKNIKTDIERLAECENMDEFRILGELIVTNIYLIKKGDTSLTCQNYYTGKDVTVKLDERISPSANSKFYYAKYNKLKRQKDFTEKKLVEDRSLLEYVLSIEDELKNLPYDSSSSSIEAELSSLGLIKRKSAKSKVRKEKPEPPYTYEYRGYTILRGKNNLQNDELTFKVAGSSDLWLHVRNGHGAHVVILTEGKTPDEDVIRVASEIAACTFGSPVDVDYTERRNVKRKPSAHPGQVIYVNYQTALASPNEHEDLLV